MQLEPELRLNFGLCHAVSVRVLEDGNLNSWLQVLGLLVSWSTFLMIGATSGLTFNVIGHLKLIIVLAGGVAFFGDQMPPKKLAGVCVALAGIAWYSFQVRTACRSVASTPGSSNSFILIRRLCSLACVWISVQLQ